MLEQEWVEEVFELGDLPLQSGEVLREARLKYLRIGQLNAPKDNLVILPMYYGGALTGNRPLVGGASPLDPGRYCILIPALLGGGESTSPSNAHPSQRGADFPQVSLYDNVLAQKRLVEQVFADAEIALVMGWSMGGLQSFQWASLFPDQVKRILPFCATARCYPHNQVFLDGVRATLTCDPVWNQGRYTRPPTAGLRAFARVYLGWAYSQAFFRDSLYRQLGFADRAALTRYWEADHLAQDANDLLAVLASWERADPGANPVFEGDTAAALGAIRARTLVMPCRTDLYFTVADATADAAAIAGAQVAVIESNFGHCAGGPGRVPAAMAQLFAGLRRLLQD